MKALLAALALVLASVAGTAPPPAPSQDSQGQSLAEMIQRRDAAAFNARFDPDAMLGYVLRGTEVPESEKRGFADGFRRSASHLGDNLMRNAQKSNVDVRLVKSTRGREGSMQIVRFTLHDADGEIAGYDYVEFDLTPEGRIRDWRSHAQGSWASETMRLLAANLFDTKSLFAVLFGHAPANKDALAALEALSAAMNRQDFRAAHAALENLPDEFKKTRQWAGLRVVLASTLGDDRQYRADLDVVAAEHGRDPEIQFMLVDYYFYRKDYAAMIESIRRFERSVVVDGALKQLECTGQLLLQRYADAERACREGTEVEPTFEHGWWTLVEVYARTHDAKKLLATIEAIEPRFHKHMDPQALAKVEGYEWLAKDATFAAWAKARK